MENMFLASVYEGGDLNTFMLSAVAYAACSFVTIYFVRPLGNKLILLGLLTALAGLVFSASMPSVRSLAWVMMFAAFFLVFYGATKSSQ
jgi:hypothetical protein